jgi:hypothetical protein
MPFDSRQQQQWYNATDQTFLDDEPSSARQVKESIIGNKIGDLANAWDIGNQRKKRQKKKYDQIEQDIDLSAWGLDDADEGVLDIFDEFADRRKSNTLGDLEERELMMSDDDTFPELEAEIAVELVSDNFGSWAEQPASLTREEELDYYKNMGMSNRTLKDMGYGDLMYSFAQQDEEHE